MFIADQLQVNVNFTEPERQLKSTEKHKRICKEEKLKTVTWNVRGICRERSYKGIRE
jgi:hypothetical protein